LVTIKDGFFKSHDEYIYTAQNVKNYAQQMDEWAKDAATKTMRIKAATIEQKEKQLAQREGDIAQREQSIESREKHMNNLETQNKRLLEERSLIGTHLGHMLGIENASMNRGKIVDAIVKTGDIQKFREILRENRISMKGQGKAIGV